MKKTARLGLILSTTEKIWVKRLAEIEGGLSEAALVRKLVREAARNHGLIMSESSHVATKFQGGGGE